MAPDCIHIAFEAEDHMTHLPVDPNLTASLPAPIRELHPPRRERGGWNEENRPAGADVANLIDGSDGGGNFAVGAVPARVDADINPAPGHRSLRLGSGRSGD